MHHKRTVVKLSALVFGLLVCASACTNEENLGARGGPDGGGTTTDAGVVAPNGEDAGNGATWNLTGTINGFALNDEAKSAFLQRAERVDSLYSEVVFTTLPNFCALPGARGYCPPVGEKHRILAITILGTAPGKYTVAYQAEPGAGEAAVQIDQFGDAAPNNPGVCSRLSRATTARSGHVTFTALDTGPGGQASLEFDVTFPEGRVTGTAVVPLCTFSE